MAVVLDVGDPHASTGGCSTSCPQMRKVDATTTGGRRHRPDAHASSSFASRSPSRRIASRCSSARRIAFFRAASRRCATACSSAATRNCIWRCGAAPSALRGSSASGITGSAPPLALFTLPCPVLSARNEGGPDRAEVLLRFEPAPRLEVPAPRCEPVPPRQDGFSPPAAPLLLCTANFISGPTAI